MFCRCYCCDKSFFFNDTATTEICTLSLLDSLPICRGRLGARQRRARRACVLPCGRASAAPRHEEDDADGRDRKSTRLNSSHANISYAVFCLKKKFKTRFITYIISTLVLLKSRRSD